MSFPFDIISIAFQYPSPNSHNSSAQVLLTYPCSFSPGRLVTIWHQPATRQAPSGTPKLNKWRRPRALGQQLALACTKLYHESTPARILSQPTRQFPHSPPPHNADFVSAVNITSKQSSDILRSASTAIPTQAHPRGLHGPQRRPSITMQHNVFAHQGPYSQADWQHNPQQQHNHYAQSQPAQQQQHHYGRNMSNVGQNGANTNGNGAGGLAAMGSVSGTGEHGASILGPGDSITDDNRRVLEWIAQVLRADTREAALLELSKKREQVPELALILWHSFGEYRGRFGCGLRS